MIYEMFFAHNDVSEMTSEICCVSMQTILIGEREGEKAREFCTSVSAN